MTTWIEMSEQEMIDITARVLATPGAATRIQPLLDELADLRGRGDATGAAQVARTIGELCGYVRDDGQHIDAIEIEQAMRYCRRWKPGQSRPFAE